eukprot:11068912-Alexandrium_andersonii.AAC.1
MRKTSVRYRPVTRRRAQQRCGPRSAERPEPRCGVRRRRHARKEPWHLARHGEHRAPRSGATRHLGN